jgi:carbonic anhydrase
MTRLPGKVEATVDRFVADRRQALRLLVGAGIVLTNSSRAFGSQPDHSGGVAAPQTPDEVLRLLMAGNERFVEKKLSHPHESKAWQNTLTKEQHPAATILGCSDSRVATEIVFDQGLGDLFVIRVAGNVVGNDVAGSVEYSVLHLHTPLVMVLGHEGCGAVTAAVQERLDGRKDVKEIQSLIDQIEPSLASVDRKLSVEDQVRAGVEANVLQSTTILSALPELAKSIQAKTLKIIPAVYDLQTGRVRLLKV